MDSAPASWGQPAGIVNVGCCYHLLTELEDDGGAVVTRGQAEVAGALSTEAGFPLSRSVAGLGLQLGLSARMLACQAVERWPTKGVALDASKMTGIGFSLSLYTADGKPNPQFGDGPFRLEVHGVKEVEHH